MTKKEKAARLRKSESVNTKVCPTCLTIKPLTDFHKNIGKRKARAVQCRKCCQEHTDKTRPPTTTRERLTKFTELQRRESESTKTCSKCLKIKRLTDFYKNKAARKGVLHQCKVCVKKDKKAQASRQLKYLYGITLEDYDRMHKAQDGRCDICGKTETENGKRLSVDHNHQTDAIRGLLCMNCNASLGGFQDDPNLLESAAQYLREYE